MHRDKLVQNLKLFDGLKCCYMKILHLSDAGLPDIRPERSALYVRNKGWDVIFAGGRPIEKQIFNAFSKTYYRYWRPSEKTGFPRSLRNVEEWVRNLIDEEKPDLIHAHDIFAGKVALNLGYPFVYDDHEIWGSRITRQGASVIKRDKTLIRRIATRYAMRNWRKWEPQILQSAPVLAVSEEIVQEYRKVQPHTYYLPNVPNQQEISMIPPNTNIDDEFRIAYVSRHDVPLSQRNDATALRLWLENRFGAKLVYIGPKIIETTEVENHGFVSHKRMLEIMATCDIALMGQQLPVPLFSLQNRFPLFLHAGLKIIIPENMIVEAKFCHQFQIGWVWSSREDLKLTLTQIIKDYFKNVAQWNHDKQRIREIAGQHFIWDRYADQLDQAYDAALKTH
jgi:glycosyltransferase involved in cell wall biosynthesis